MEDDDALELADTMEDDDALEEMLLGDRGFNRYFGNLWLYIIRI